MPMASMALPATMVPTAPGGLLRASGLALLAHALLVGALSLGLNWRLSPPQPVLAAELWSAVPKVAAPAAAQTSPPLAAPAPASPSVAKPPTPAPRSDPAPAQRDAQIATEQAKSARLKEERRQRDLAVQRQARAEAEAEDARQAQQREANLARIRSQAGAEGGATASGAAVRDAAPSAAYAGRIKARIKANIVLTSEVSGNPVTEVEVRCALDGSIIGRRIVKSSGDRGWDDTVLRAIDRTEVLPRDETGRVPSPITLVMARRE